MDRYPPIDYAPFSPRVPYPDSSSIDWTLEYAKERSRLSALARRTGVQGALSRLVDSALPWLVVVATGVTVGLLAASMDVVTAWLADLRSGVCRDQWWMSRRSCCTGLDAGEICNAWKTWGDVAGQESVHVVVRSLTQYSLYILLAVRSLDLLCVLTRRSGRIRRHLVVLCPNLRSPRVPHRHPRDQDRARGLHHRRLPQRLDAPD